MMSRFEMLFKPMTIDLAERIESLKAGLIGGGAIALAYGISLMVHGVLAAQSPVPLDLLPLPLSLMSWQGWVGCAIAILSGFLFGVTYRYAVRLDPNSHLKSGVVMAFALVRGLAQVEVGLRLGQLSFMLAVLVGESIVMFAIAQFVLDWAISQRMVQPMK